MTRPNRSLVARTLLVLFTPLGISTMAPLPAEAGAGHNHGGGSEEELKEGEFRSMPVITLEGHGGYENNLTSEGKPSHYAVDGMFGAVMEWGLANQGSFAIEAAIGPALVWGEAEHFYGRVHLEKEHEEESSSAHAAHADHDEHGEEDHEEEEGEDHGDEDHGDKDHGDEDHGNEGHSDHSEHSEEGHESHAGHGHAQGQPYRRIDMKGMLQARYQPNDRLAISATWLPYFVTKSQGEDIQGVKHEVSAGVTYAFGDGDVNFALGDGLESVIDGVFVSVSNHTGWESDGVYIGNYTDTWAGFGFNYDQLNVTLTGGPRFYTPGSYSGLSQRTDWGGEIALEYPISDSVVAFAHWEAIYSTETGKGWGKGFQNHIGTGLTFRF